MRRICFFLVIAILWCLRVSPASAQSQTDGKLWLGFAGQFELSRALRLDVTEEFRIDDSWSGYEKWFTELSLRFRVNEFLRLGGSYRFIIAEADPQRGRVQHRGAGDVELRYRQSPWEVAYRLRLQSTSRSDGSRTYVRNRIKGGYKLTKRIEPFVAGEIFYSTTKGEFREVRAYVGASWELSRKLQLGGFYMYSNEFNVNTPLQSHILGLEVAYRFREVGGKKSKGGKAGGDDDDDDSGDRDVADD